MPNKNNTRLPLRIWTSDRSGIALSPSVRRTARSLAVAATLFLCGTGTLQNAVANGDTRTLTFTNPHTGEAGSFTFKKDGRYDPEVLKQLNWLARDWRKDEPIEMDPHLFDLLWEVYREVGATAPITLLCGYRSPSTNAMLRSRSKAVAETSQHMRGRAMDFYIPGVRLAELRETGLRLQRGGVGFYPSQNFVHMDTGGVRMWPRMSREELARVFPDGKTVLIPTDGKPMSGYQLALAELEARGSVASDAPQADGFKGIRNFFASLFGKPAPEESDAGEVEGVQPERAPRATQVASAAPSRVATPAPAPAASAPLPPPQASRPVVTAVSTTPLPSARPAEIAAAAMLTAHATNAPFAPLPIKRPQAPTQVASLEPAGAPVPLPAVIMRGTSERSEIMGPPPSTALGYAAGGDIASALPPNPAIAAAPQSRLRGSSRTAADIPFGRVFRGPGLWGEAYLKMPETRVFTAFLTAPQEVVAQGFGKDPTGGLSTSRFSGEAIAVLPTYVFQAPPVRLSQRGL